MVHVRLKLASLALALIAQWSRYLCSQKSGVSFSLIPLIASENTWNVNILNLSVVGSCSILFDFSGVIWCYL